MSEQFVPTEEERKMIPACQHLAITAKIWLIHRPWILKTALSVNGASDRRRERTQVAGFLRQEVLWWQTARAFVAVRSELVQMNGKHGGHGRTGWLNRGEMVQMGSPPQCMSDQQHWMATWGGSLGYHVHEVNMHVVQWSKHVHVCLRKRDREKRKCVRRKKRNPWATWEGVVEERSRRASDTSIYHIPPLHLTLSRTMCFSFEAPEQRLQ